MSKHISDVMRQKPPARARVWGVILPEFFYDVVKPTLSTAEWCIFEEILRTYYKLGEKPTPISTTELMRRTGLSDATVRRTVKDLEKKGLIFRVQRRVAGRDVASLFTPNLHYHPEGYTEDPTLYGIQGALSERQGTSLSERQASDLHDQDDPPSSGLIDVIAVFRQKFGEASSPTVHGFEKLLKHHSPPAVEDAINRARQHVDKTGKPLSSPIAYIRRILDNGQEQPILGPQHASGQMKPFEEAKAVDPWAEVVALEKEMGAGCFEACRRAEQRNFAAGHVRGCPEWIAICKEELLADYPAWVAGGRIRGQY